MAGRVLTIGTRGSRLALEQTRQVEQGLEGPGEVVIIKTSGDRFAEVSLQEQSQVGFFTKEIEDALLSHRIDLAVHSLKDLPVELAPGLVLAAILRREAPEDILLVQPGALDPRRPVPLREGARVGASSLRRKSLLQTLRPDLVSVPMRGNVPTRVEKASSGEVDAIVIARAGLARLAIEPAPLAAFELNPSVWICAPGQAAIAVEVREDDLEARGRVGALDHALTRGCVDAERNLLFAYGGGCHSPFAAWAFEGAEGFGIHAGAPDRNGRFQFAFFSGDKLDEVRLKVERWIRKGCPAQEEAKTLRQEEWICRPAQPWS